MQDGGAGDSKNSPIGFREPDINVYGILGPNKHSQIEAFLLVGQFLDPRIDLWVFIICKKLTCRAVSHLAKLSPGRQHSIRSASPKLPELPFVSAPICSYCILCSALISKKKGEIVPQFSGAGARFNNAKHSRYTGPTKPNVLKVTIFRRKQRVVGCSSASL